MAYKRKGKNRGNGASGNSIPKNLENQCESCNGKIRWCRDTDGLRLGICERCNYPVTE